MGGKNRITVEVVDPAGNGRAEEATVGYGADVQGVLAAAGAVSAAMAGARAWLGRRERTGQGVAEKGRMTGKSHDGY